MGSDATLIPKASPYVLGVDLGTSNSSVSVYHKGLPVTISVEGAKSLPSVVQFKNRKRDGLSVGKNAKRNILISPEEVFTSIKRDMKNEAWREDGALMEKLVIDGEQLEPVHIAAEILKKLMEEVQDQTGFDLKGSVRRAVICVPANTTDEYRRNVYKAAALAGIGEVDESQNVIITEDGRPEGVWLLEEPTAAAIAYGHELGIYQAERDQTILVYDLGGGTFDVTILRVESKEGESPKFTVKATKGVSRLGGDDFDQIVMELCAERFKEQSGIDIFDLKSDQAGGTSGRALKEAQQKLKEGAEQAKIAFAGGSQREEITIAAFLKDGNSRVHDLELEINKSEFVERVQPLLDQTKNCITDVLNEANLTLDDINRVILVGGSTKADWVVDSLKSLYPAGQEREPYRASDVDVIVSQGASIFGASRPVELEDAPELILDLIVSHHLGIELDDRSFGLVLEKGLPLTEEAPVQTATKTYGNQENQDSLQIVIWKTQKSITFEETENGRKPEAKSYINEIDDQGNRTFECIGEFSLKGVPKAPKGREEIEVTMEINRDNLLKVNAKVLSTGKEQDQELSVDRA